MNYRTYQIEQSSTGSWHVMDPTNQVGYACMGVFTTRREAKSFVDELLAAAGRGIAQAMAAMRKG